MSEAQILFSSAFFDAGGGGHGGNRRARQIFDLLSRTGPGVAPMTSVRDRAMAGLQLARWRTALDYVRDVHVDPLRRARVLAGFARNYGDARRGLALHPKARVLIWEDTTNAHVMRAAKDAGLRVVAVPQNLESLVPDMAEGRTGQVLPWSFEYEVAQLARADRVYTISREEQWLLRLRGIDAQYVPFFPGAAERERWLALRAARQGPFDRYVILGSAVNPPTRAGIHDILRWLASAPDTARAEIHVAGYGTEVFRELASDRIKVHGALGDDELFAQLRRARAVLLHQGAAVGALIRVSEMLLAGIPVIANPIAARSTGQYQGVVIYESMQQLAGLLGRETWEPPPLPGVPDALEHEFIEDVRACLR
jgi:glycosyltransferase involved in cell wall biosynthesis